MDGEGVGKYIADVLRYATRELLPHGSVTLYEMGDVLLQFLGTNLSRHLPIPRSELTSRAHPKRCIA